MEGCLNAAPRSFEPALRPALPATAQDFVVAMSRAVTGVSIVTTDGAAGRYGVTVSAMASVSADPPLVLVCINQRSPAAAALTRNGMFCVSLLAAHQDALADRFAGRPRSGAPFCFGSSEAPDAEWRRTPSGAWRLVEAVASFDCTLEASHDAGSHRIFIGQVAAVATSPHAPLGYCGRSYCITGQHDTAFRRAS